MRLVAALIAACALAAGAGAETVTPFYAAVATPGFHGVISSDGDHRAVPIGLFGAISLSPDGPDFVSSDGPTKLFVGSLAYGGRIVKTPARTADAVYGPDDVIAYGAGPTLRVVGGRTYRLPGTVVQVAVGPANTFAATVETGNGKAGTLRSRLYLVAAGRTRLLASGFDAYSERPTPQISPDGLSVAYTKGGDVWVVDRSGRKQQITHTRIAAETDVRWSPDGTELGYTTGRHGVNEVYVASLDGHELRLTHTAPRGRGIPQTGSRMGAWSPDGASVAVITYNAIGVVPATGGSERIVKTFTPANAAYVGPLWWSGSY